jgi:hypothetical protein
MQVKMQTPATRDALTAIVRRDFAGSQVEFSRQCGLDVADTSRVLAAVRPATIQLVCRATAALDDVAASQLVEAFLSDILAMLPKPYAVVVQPSHPKLGKASSTSRNRSPGK